MPDETHMEESTASVPEVASGVTLTRAVPSFMLILLADLATVWAAVTGSWTALVVWSSA